MTNETLNNETIAIASDHAGYELKQLLVSYLQELGAKVEDLGTHSNASVDYPDFGNAMGAWITKNPNNKGVLICGSGIGISIAANRHSAVRAALVSDGLSASLSRQHNNANVLCLGARIIGVDMAKHCVKQFFTTAFEGGRHATRLEKLL